MHLQDLEGGTGPRESQVVDTGAEAQAAAAAAQGNAQHCQNPHGRRQRDEERHCRSQASILPLWLFATCAAKQIFSTEDVHEQGLSLGTACKIGLCSRTHNHVPTSCCIQCCPASQTVTRLAVHRCLEQHLPWSNETCCRDHAVELPPAVLGSRTMASCQHGDCYSECRRDDWMYVAAWAFAGNSLSTCHARARVQWADNKLKSSCYMQPFIMLPRALSRPLRPSWSSNQS